MELSTLPSQVLILGGGYISFEFANVAMRVGAKVAFVDRHTLQLRSFDPELVRLLVRSSRAAGMEILTVTEATSIEQHNGRIEVGLRTAGGESLLSTDLVVNGGGRVPNLDELNLDAGQVEYGAHGVKVNQFLQSTTNSVVYAAGDCADTGVPMLTPTASKSARFVAMNILSAQQWSSEPFDDLKRPGQNPDYGCVPQVVFSVPTLARVG